MTLKDRGRFIKTTEAGFLVIMIFVTTSGLVSNSQSLTELILYRMVGRGYRKLTALADGLTVVLNIATLNIKC